MTPVGVRDRRETLIVLVVVNLLAMVKAIDRGRTVVNCSSPKVARKLSKGFRIDGKGSGYRADETCDRDNTADD